MDRTEAIRRFCRENVAFLSSPQAADEAVRKLRVEYATKHSLRASERFDNREVAEEVVNLYLRTHKTALEEFLKIIISVPLVRENVSQDDLKLAHQSRDASVKGVINPSDLGKVSQEEFIARIEDQLREQAKGRAEEELKAEQEELAKLKEQVAEERKALQKFKSDLDSILPSTSAAELARGLAPEVPKEPEKLPTPWWKEIGLVGDPFPTYTGLDQIPAEKYDDVVVLTPFFRRYAQEVNAHPDMLLGKTVLISGEFGSGKTTLLQYLSATAGRHHIIPIDINFITYDQLESLTKELVTRICDSLATIFLFRHGRDPRSEGINRDAFAFAAELFQTLQTAEGARGFLVCVDGLHKGTMDARPVFNFLQQLQNVQEYFSHRKLNVGFMVAGSPLWERQLEQTPSLSGSFHRKDAIPPLTEDSAVEAVERRIRTFSMNSAMAPTIDKQDLRRTFQILAQRIQRPLTFRDFLRHIGSRLEARAYTEAGITVTLHIETIEAVQAILRESAIGRRLEALFMDLGQEQSMREACCSVLTGLLEKGGASEFGPLYHSYRPAFYLLRKNDLIAQRRSAGQSSFEWTLSPDLKASIANVGQRLSISARAAVTAAFEEPRSRRRAESGIVYEQAVQALNSLIPAWKDQWPQLVEPLEKCRAMLAQIDKLSGDAKWRDISANHFTETVEALIRAQCAIAFGDDAARSNPWQVYTDSWLAPENSDKIRLFSSASFRRPANETEFFGMIHDHNEAIVQLLRELREFLLGENICRLARRHLTEEEYAKLNALRRQFNQFAYKEVIDGACELIESRIRSNSYVGLRAVWGDTAFDKLPPDVRAAVEQLPNRGHARTKRARDSNFLYDVSRSEYSKILLGGNIFKALFGNDLPIAERDKLRDALSLAFSLDDRRAHRDRGSYFKDKATEIGSVLRELPWVLETLHGLASRFVLGAEVVYNHVGSDFLEASFLPGEQSTLSPVPIRVEGKDVQSLCWFQLTRHKEAARVLSDLISVCQSSASSPESQLLILRLLLKRGLLKSVVPSRWPLSISITAEGEAFLQGRASWGG